MPSSLLTRAQGQQVRRQRERLQANAHLDSPSPPPTPSFLSRAQQAQRQRRRREAEERGAPPQAFQPLSSSDANNGLLSSPSNHARRSHSPSLDPRWRTGGETSQRPLAPRENVCWKNMRQHRARLLQSSLCYFDSRSSFRRI